MSDQVKNEQLELLQTFDAVLQLVENPAAFSETEASQIILDGHKALNQALLKEEEAHPTTFVIYSANEAATQDGAGFWSSEQKNWTSEGYLTGDDFYSKEDTETESLPASVGQDAAFVPAHQFGLLEIQRQL